MHSSPRAQLQLTYFQERENGGKKWHDMKNGSSPLGWHVDDNARFQMACMPACLLAWWLLACLSLANYFSNFIPSSFFFFFHAVTYLSLDTTRYMFLLGIFIFSRFPLAALMSLKLKRAEEGWQQYQQLPACHSDFAGKRKLSKERGAEQMRGDVIGSTFSQLRWWTESPPDRLDLPSSSPKSSTISSP